MPATTRTSKPTPGPMRHDAERATDTRLIAAALVCCVAVVVAIVLGLGAGAASIAGLVGLAAVALVGTAMGLAIAHALIDRRER